MYYQQDFFEKAAERWPDRAAIDDHGDVTTYATLEADANRLAHLLIDCGAGPNERVCILTSKSAACYRAILGTLKAGSAWVPLSTVYPPDRLRALVSSLRPVAIVVDATTRKLVRDLAIEAPNFSVIGLDFGETGWLGQSDVAAKPAMRPMIGGRSPEDIAYIVFTSGSTGMAKGVVVLHRNTSMFLNCCREFFLIEEGARFAHFSEPTFDPSIFDLFHCWQTGGTLVPFNRRSYRINPAPFFLEQDLNVVFTVPSVIESLREGGQLGRSELNSIRHLLLTGEAVRPDLIESWCRAYPDATLYNMYGTTETAIVSHWCILPKSFGADARVPVGHVLPHLRVSLLNGDEEVAVGEVGESVVYGTQISPGYWANRFQTEASFVRNPIDTDLPQAVYRTGDLLTKDHDGLHYFVGRADSMVKIRGHRVELGEVESQLRLHDEVSDAAVVSVQGGKGAYDNRLVAFVKAGSLTEDDLHAWLSGRIPSYMLPVRTLIISHDFPRNINGKVDRRALSRIAVDATAKEGAQDD